MTRMRYPRNVYWTPRKIFMTDVDDSEEQVPEVDLNVEHMMVINL